MSTAAAEVPERGAEDALERAANHVREAPVHVQDRGVRGHGQRALVERLEQNPVGVVRPLPGCRHAARRPPRRRARPPPRSGWRRGSPAPRRCGAWNRGRRARPASLRRSSPRRAPLGLRRFPAWTGWCACPIMAPMKRCRGSGSSLTSVGAATSCADAASAGCWKMSTTARSKRPARCCSQSLVTLRMAHTERGEPPAT